jgi:cytochrome oxidase Cu insertion factor (SCO1/SenC/PrrC family)
MRFISGAGLVAGLLTAMLAVASTAKGDDDQTGLKLGSKAPAFTLKDQDGQPRSLDDFLKKGKVALVFYRSANW